MTMGWQTGDTVFARRPFERAHFLTSRGGGS
jgi:hypothetical protein